MDVVVNIIKIKNENSRNNWRDSIGSIDKDYWQQELEEIWCECHNYKYLVENTIVHDDWDEVVFLRCEHYHEIEKDEVKKEHCPDYQRDEIKGDE